MVTSSRRLISSVWNRLEGFLLIFVQRVALRAAAPADDLAQVIECHQVVAPEAVDRLQRDRLFDVAHDVGVGLASIFELLDDGGFLGGGGFVGEL